MTSQEYPTRTYQIPPASSYAYPLQRNLPISPVPPPPPHRSSPQRPFVNKGVPDPSSRRPVTRGSDTTSDADYLGPRAAGGGITGIALGVADDNGRASGLQASRGIENWNTTDDHGCHGEIAEYPHQTHAGYSNDLDQYDYIQGRQHSQGLPSYDSHASTEPREAAPGPGNLLAPTWPRSAPHLPPADRPTPNRYLSSDSGQYNVNAYNDLPPRWDQRLNQAGLGSLNPLDIADDDDDDGLEVHSPRRKPLLGLRRPLSKESNPDLRPATAAVGGVTAGGGLAKAFEPRDSSGNYGPVPEQAVGFDAAMEKSEWLRRQDKGKRKLKWIVGLMIAFFVVAAIVGAVVGGVLGSRKSTNNGSQGASAAGGGTQGDLNKDSLAVQKLLGNKNLHKVFPGMDYTPLNTQYPACLTNPPLQNNITLDMAVLSQVTNAVRLYGTDCNQTQTVLHAINRLGLTDMKVWLGVWIDDNSTTMERQLDQMYQILDENGAGPFAGVIVGNEVLYRQNMTATQLSTLLSDVRANLTSRNINLPLATSDLGNDWTQGLTTNVDIVMSNIHPFFGGVAASAAAQWTWNFWQQHDVILTQGTTKQNIISEVGWPSQGGNDCSPATCTDSTSGSVAGIDEMNTFMDDFVCQSLANGTVYFWFEAFDEPWKIQYDTPNENWEDHWGLFDVDRNLKPGVVIPDCGGKTVA